MKITAEMQKLLLDAPMEAGERVEVAFCRLKFDVNEDGTLEDIVTAIAVKEKRVLGVWYAEDCPFRVEGVTP